MHQIYRNQLSADLLEELNRGFDENSLTRPDDGSGYQIVIPPTTREIIAPLEEKLRKQFPELRMDENSFVVVRTTSEKGNKASQAWHFDNLRETTLIVLKSTTGENNGDILIKEGLRKFPMSLTWYALTKIFWTNPISWIFLRNPWIRDRFFKRIPLKAGDIMVFEGGSVFHGNLPIDSGTRRSILVHNEPLFPGTWVTKLFHKMNKVYFYKN